ncbi:MAG: HAD family phosphatase [Treponema sp.]|jgi:putative hydrolase of the HAD superfamily|nr:HAD family phosphatase [Treponema sp.]
MTIKAVVFDYGKVICLPPAAGVMDELASLAGLPVQDMDTLVWKHRGEYDRGMITGQAYYRNLLSHGGVFPDDALLERMLQIDLDSWKRINPATITLMEDIKAAGYKLGILSNMPHDFLAWVRETISVIPLLDAEIFSCEVGSIKPENAIYEILLHRLDCKAEEVIFFDDISENVGKAQTLGIRGFLWKDPETARETLHAWGVSKKEPT